MCLCWCRIRFIICVLCINCSVDVIFSPHFQSRIGEKTPQRPSVEAGPVLPWRLSGRAKHTDNDLCCIVFESLRLRLFPFLFEWIHAPMLDSVVVHPAFFTGMIAFVLPLLETAMGRLPFGIPSCFLPPPPLSGFCSACAVAVCVPLAAAMPHCFSKRSAAAAVALAVRRRACS